MTVGPMFPNAPEKEIEYRSLANALLAIRNTIDIEIGASQVTALTTDDTYTLDGLYYDHYVNSNNNWLKTHNDIINRFYKYVTELDTCIENANKKASMWHDRIDITEEQ